MSFIQIANLIIVNIIIWLIFNYFWSNWSFKLFKPYRWLDAYKSKSIHKRLISAERHCKDKNRFYQYWLSIEQIDENNVDGATVFIGIEDAQYPAIASLARNEREIVLCDNFKNEKIEVVKENCQGIVSKQIIDINKPSISEIEHLMADNRQLRIINANICDSLEQLPQKIAFAAIDNVDYNNVLSALQRVYTLLAPGGIIIVHDYNHDWDDVHRAVKYFEASVDEFFTPLPDMFGSCILVKNKSKK